MALRQRFVYRRDDRIIRQQLIDVTHPCFAQIAHLLGDQAIAKAELRAAHLDHAAAFRGLRRRSGRRSS